ncbi:MAG: hypothetical protein ACO1OF_13085 [Adhaeribacter sp.]
MRNQLQLVPLLLLLLFSCKKDELSKTLNFQQFTITVPSNWESYSLQGIDSKAGGIKNKKDKLEYDFGWYSYAFQKETTATHTRILTTIDGKHALIVKPIKKGQGVIGVFIQVDSLNKFSLSGMDIKNEDTAIKIFESVKF